MVLCECGVELKRIKPEHYKTKKHIQYLKNIEYINSMNITDNFNIEQLNFIKSDIKTCKVIGNPGCGKTRSIIEYCIYKYRTGIINSSNDFLITSYSKSAIEDFIIKGNKQCSEFNNNSKSKKLSFNNNNVKTIHSLAKYIYHKFCNSESDLNTIILAAFRLLDRITKETYIEYIPKYKDIKFIIVDEAQDLNKNQYKLICKLSEILNVPCILVGDPNQSIYQFQGSSDKFLTNHSDNIYPLVKNYRSNIEIINFLNELRPYNNLPKMESGCDINGKKPIVIVDDRENICKFIIDKIKNSGYNYEDIAIIGPVKLSKNNISFGLQYILHYLIENNIDYVKYYKDGNDTDTNNNYNKSESGKINILTCHKSKGLEFKMTIIINFHLNTFSRRPTIEAYNNFKYLWYVGLSRAKDELIICTEKSKSIFTEIGRIGKDLFEVFNTELNTSKYKLCKNLEESYYDKSISVTNIINNKLYLTEDKFLDFQEKQFYIVDDKSVYNIEYKNLIDNDEHCMLYGIFMQNLFIYYYYKNKNNIEEFINLFKIKIDNKIIVLKEQMQIYNELVSIGYINDNKLILKTINKKNIYEKLNNKYINNNKSKKEDIYKMLNFIYDFIIDCKLKSKSDICEIYKYDISREWDTDNLYRMFNCLLNSQNNSEEIIFKITCYFYQFEYEKKYILDLDFSNNLKELSYYHQYIKQLASSYNNLLFEKNVFMEFDIDNNVNKSIQYLTGRIDIIDLNTNQVIELKFTNELNTTHELQVLMYKYLYDPKFKYKTPPYLINLKSGIKRVLNISNNNIWDYNVFLYTLTNQKMKNQLFILDLETNTIDNNSDFTYPPNTEIIDRYVYSYNFNSTISDGLIKNRYPLTTSHITNIYDKDLLNADNNLEKFKKEINEIFKSCDNPIFMAHNGLMFDLPILEYHKILETDEYIYRKSDSMHILHQLNLRKSRTKKLIDIYNSEFNINHVQEHRAKGDVMLIVNLFKHYNLSANKIILGLQKS